MYFWCAAKHYWGADIFHDNVEDCKSHNLEFEM